MSDDEPSNDSETSSLSSTVGGQKDPYDGVTAPSSPPASHRPLVFGTPSSSSSSSSSRNRVPSAKPLTSATNPASRSAPSLKVSSGLRLDFNLQNGPANLPPSLRVFRHLKRVFARNLLLLSGSTGGEAEPVLFNCSFSLLAGEPLREVYSSELLSATMNPDWSSLSPQRLFGETTYFHPLRQCQRFVVRVHHWSTPTSNQLLLEASVDLAALGFLGNLEGIALPPNTLIFELNDGLYADRTVIQGLQPSNRFLDIRSFADMYPRLQELPDDTAAAAVSVGDESTDASSLSASGQPSPVHTAALSSLSAPSVSTSVLKQQQQLVRSSSSSSSASVGGKRLVTVLETYSVAQLREAVRLYAELQHSLNKTKELAELVAARVGEQRPLLEMQRRRDQLRRRVRQERREELDRARQALAGERAALEQLRKEVLPRAKQLHQAQIALIANKQQLAERRTQLDRDYQLYLLRCDTLNIRRGMLISQLRTIYPITQLSDRTLAIAGFALPNSDFTGCDEELVATALGYVCHALYMIAKWLQVPLRYAMIPMCSRSFIRDDISQEASPKFPLYSRGMDRPRFEYAVFLLNKNLEQLMSHRNLEIQSLRHTLPNLLKLYQVAEMPAPSTAPGS